MRYRNWKHLLYEILDDIIPDGLQTYALIVENYLRTHGNALATEIDLPPRT